MMLARCKTCDCHYTAYAADDPGYSRCPACGGTRVFATHLGFFGRQSHEVEIELGGWGNSKLTGHDPCDVSAQARTAALETAEQLANAADRGNAEEIEVALIHYRWAAARAEERDDG